MRSLPPLLVGLGLLLGLGVTIVACDTPPPSPATSSNATLSNAALLQQALAHMQTLTSYHFDFHGGRPSQTVQMSLHLHIAGDMQWNGQGSRISMRDEGGGAVGSPSLMLDVGQGIDVRLTPDAWYESYDGGHTWDQPQTDTPGGFLLAMFGWWWAAPGSAAALTSPTPGPGTNLLTALTFQDGTPRTESIAGVPTRHLVADVRTQPVQRDPALLTYGEGAQTLSVWISTDLTPTIRQLQITGSTPLKQNEISPANAVAFSPDGTTLAVAHGFAEDWTLHLWDLRQPTLVPQKLRGTVGPFSSVAFSPDGQWLAAGAATGGAPGQVTLWDRANLARPPITLPVASGIHTVAFRPDGQQLAAAGVDGIYLWAPPYAGAPATVLPHPAGNVVNTLAWSADNHTLASGNLNAGVRVYDLQHPAAAPTIFPDGEVNAVVFSPDGHLLAATGSTTNGGNTVQIWDLRQAAPTPTILPGDQVRGETLAFSPNGRLLAASGQDDQVRIWNLQPGPAAESAPRPALVLGGGRLVYGVAFSPNGQQLAAASSDGAVRLWDLPALPASDKLPAPTPTILKENEQLTDTPYTLTWQWSQFNEPFGEIKAPPPETVKTP